MVSVSHGQNVELTIEESRKIEYALEIKVTEGSFKFAVGQSAAKSYAVDNKGAVHNKGDSLKVLLRQSEGTQQALNLNFMAGPEGGTFHLNPSLSNKSANKQSCLQAEHTKPIEGVLINYGTLAPDPKR